MAEGGLRIHTLTAKRGSKASDARHISAERTVRMILKLGAEIQPIKGLAAHHILHFYHFDLSGAPQSQTGRGCKSYPCPVKVRRYMLQGTKHAGYPLSHPECWAKWLPASMAQQPSRLLRVVGLSSRDSKSCKRRYSYEELKDMGDRNAETMCAYRYVNKIEVTQAGMTSD